MDIGCIKDKVDGVPIRKEAAVKKTSLLGTSLRVAFLVIIFILGSLAGGNRLLSTLSLCLFNMQLSPVTISTRRDSGKDGVRRNA